MKTNNLLLVAGTGRNSGKTTIICKIIEQFRDLEITSVKISPHFHPPSDGLRSYCRKPGYEIFEETNRHSLKDSSRMLQSGAKKAYYIQTTEENINQAFSEVYLNIQFDKPVICESPSLINYIKPGLFIIMTSPSGNNLKKIENLKRFPHIECTYSEIISKNPLPVIFENGIWKVHNHI
jgi:hypothetical protein